MSSRAAKKAPVQHRKSAQQHRKVCRRLLVCGFVPWGHVLGTLACRVDVNGRVERDQDV